MSRFMRKPLERIEVYHERLKKLGQDHVGSCFILGAAPEAIRNKSVHYPYRQDSSFYYLTGFEEPESFLVFRPGMNPEKVLFVRPKDPLRETWDGFRFGVEGAKAAFGFDVTYSVQDIKKELPKLFKGVDRVYFSRRKNNMWDQIVEDALFDFKMGFGRSGLGLLPVYDLDSVLGEFRLFKSDLEIERMRTACQISAEAHSAAMRFVKPGVNERQVHAVLIHHMMMKGAAREGYNGIVASGDGATTLHYVFNDQECKDGDLLLIDAGAEYNYYTGDITRVFPVNGVFTSAQSLVYDAVLTVQKSILNQIKPGFTFSQMSDVADSLLVDAMLDLGLLTGRKTDILQSKEHKKYYPHGIGHWLGMDVHDVGLYSLGNDSRPFEPGMCFTVEPGIYIPAQDSSAPKEFRGIGVRIEDNILITPSGYEVLTKSCPKERGEIQDLMAKP